VVHLRSVFTHMGPSEVEHYLGEIARVLKPGARCMATYFLLNRESLAMMSSLPVRQFPYEHREHVPARGEARSERGEGEFVPYRVSEPGDVGAVAHFERYARRSIMSSGLQVVEPIQYGRWCARPAGLCNQDIVVVARAREV
jgi:hypothetical protein